MLLKTLLMALTMVGLMSHFAASAAAAGPGRRGREGRGVDRNERWDRMVSRLDENEDGQLSRGEFLGKHGAFDKADADGNGVVTREEAEALQGRRGHGDMFRHADSNGDGKVTLEEVKAKREAVFDKIDANGDGFVEKGEFMSFKPERPPERS